MLFGVLLTAVALGLVSCASQDDLRADRLGRSDGPSGPPTAIDFLAPAPPKRQPASAQAAAPASTLPASGGTQVRPTPAPERPRGFVQYAPQRGASGHARLGEAGLPALERAGNGTVTINFAEADLETVVHTILGEQLQQNYTIDPGLNGTVTLQSSRPVTRQQLLSTLQEILRMNGAALINRDGLYAVVRAAKAGSVSSGVTFDQAASRGLTVRVTPLRHTDVGSIGKILEKFAPAGGEIFLDDERDLVFTVATTQEQESLLDIISVLDVDYLGGLAFALEPLEDADAATLVSELRAIANRPGGGEEDGSEPLRFVPIERMNAVLVVARSNRYLEEALTWISRLDAGAADTEQLFVYPVKRRRAAELAALIGQIFNVETIADEVGLQAGLAPGRQPVDLAGDGGAGAAPAGGLPIGPAPGPPARARAANAAFAQGRAGPFPGGSGGVRVIADRSTNSLVIYATAEQYEPIKAALDRLDVLPKQVLIEATLVEVSLRNQLEYGVRWFFQNITDAELAADPGRSQGSRATFSDLSDGAIASQFPGFNYILDTASVDVVLTALRDVTDVELLSSPNMMVLDNQTARLQVGDEVPIQTRSAVDVTNPGAPVVNDIDYRDTGVILSVTPRVTSDGLVVLDVIQEVSDVVETGSSDISSPTIQQRRFESTVAVGDGDTIVLGGLTRNSASVGRVGVPVLSKIPLFGNLFTSRSNSQRRTELLVMIKPKVIRDQTEMRVATEEMKRKLRIMFDDKPSPAKRIIYPLRTLGVPREPIGGGGVGGTGSIPSSMP